MSSSWSNFVEPRIRFEDLHITFGKGCTVGKRICHLQSRGLFEAEEGFTVSLKKARRFWKVPSTNKTRQSCQRRHSKRIGRLVIFVQQSVKWIEMPLYNIAFEKFVPVTYKMPFWCTLFGLFEPCFVFLKEKSGRCVCFHYVSPLR